MIVIKTPDEIERMRAAGKLTAHAHSVVAEAVKPGVTTLELDRLVVDFLNRHDAIAAFKGYNGYPKSICVSVNDEVVHGIPGPRVLENGDIVSVDIGVIKDGYVGDHAWTYRVGQVNEAAENLLLVTEQALMAGIEQARAGNRLSDISHAIQSLAEREGMGVVRDFVGHGVGRSMHEAPQIPNFGPAGRGPKLRAGMTLAIEPMLNLGGPEVEVQSDDWTVITRDGSLSAHFEHNVLVTSGDPEILTLP